MVELLLGAILGRAVQSPEEFASVPLDPTLEGIAEAWEQGYATC